MGCPVGVDVVVGSVLGGGRRRIRLVVLLSEMQALLTGNEVAEVVDLAVVAETLATTLCSWANTS